MLQKAQFLDYLGLILLSAIWGSSFLFIKLSVETIHPSFLTFSRLLIASLFLLIYLKFFKKIKLFPIKLSKELLIISILGNVIPFNLISWSETNIDSVVVATLIGTMPLFTFIIAHFFFDGEKLNNKIISGLIIGFTGMLFLVYFEDSNKKDHQTFSNLSNLLVILASICYAYSANCVKKIKGMNSLQIATSSTLIATVVSLPICFLLMDFSRVVKDYHIFDISLSSFFSCFMLGAICTSLAIVIFFSLIHRQSAGFASQSNFLIPCFGVFWSYLFLSESLGMSLLISLILIILGLCFVHFGRKKNEVI